jgi:hypothetical protein
MVDILESSLVRIYSLHHWVVGAGFLVDGRHILTCAHGVKEARLDEYALCSLLQWASARTSCAGRKASRRAGRFACR